MIQLIGMAVGLGTGVPWVMCKQDDASDPIVSAAHLCISQNYYHRHFNNSMPFIDKNEMLHLHAYWLVLIKLCCLSLNFIFEN